MASRFEPARGLDVTIARVFGVPAVRKAVAMLETEAKRNAPPVRVWVTMRDERVRASHMDADTQTIPANLRFRLDKASGVGIDLARSPRDPDLPIENRINCRCDDPSLDAPLRDSIHATDVVQTGTRVQGSVETRFPRAAESEFGTDRDTPAYFMTTALHEVAARLRGATAT